MFTVPDLEKINCFVVMTLMNGLDGFSKSERFLVSDVHNYFDPDPTL